MSVREKILCASIILCVAICGLIVISNNAVKYDIENVDVVLNISSKEEYDTSFEIAKFYWEGKEIDTTKKKGFTVGYSYDSSCNVVNVHLMQKGHTPRKISFVLDK